MKAIFAEPMTATALADLCGGVLCGETETASLVCGLCTDSGEADCNTAFVALRGARADGHDYIAQAIRNGCRCVICERLPAETVKGTMIVVSDSEAALSVAAHAYQKSMNCRTIAVTGSVGKTTTKDMIAAVLSEVRRVYSSEGNHNSVIGMPLSMLEIDTACEYAVLEMGMSGFGEIRRMSLTAEPEIGIITNIGSSHLEQLGSRENICRAKAELLCGLQRNGVLLLNGDEPLLSDIGEEFHPIYVSLLRSSADYFAQNIRMENDCMVFDVSERGVVCCSDLCIRVLGRHNVYAALFAFAVGRTVGLSVEEIRRGLLRYETSGMRQHRYLFHGMTVFEDCYNASPESMCAAVETLSDYAERCGSRSIAVLGDMLELGTDSETMHRQVGVQLAKADIDRLFTVGKGGMQIARGAIGGGMDPHRIVSVTEDPAFSELCTRLLSELRAGDCVLFKASRSVRLERLIDLMKSKV